MRTRQLFHFAISGTVASFTTVLAQAAITGDWSPFVAGGVGLAAALLYLVVARAVPRPQWLQLFPEELTRWLKDYGQIMLVLALSVALLVITITIWTRNERPAMDRTTLQQPSVTPQVEEQSISEPPNAGSSPVRSIVEHLPAKEREAESSSPELRTRPLCELGLMPDLENCDDLALAVDDCGLYAVRSGELTHPVRADSRGATWSFRGCLTGWRMSWETCTKGEKNCYLLEFTGEKGYRDMRDFEGN